MFRTTDRIRRSAKRFAPLIAVGTIALSVHGNAADVQATKYQLAVIEGTPGADRILAGDFRIAATEITQSVRIPDSDFASSNNLCVAYTIQKDFAEAHRHCNAAVALARTSNGGSSIGSDRRVHNRTNKAVALSNRGVMHALRGDLEKAHADFKRARRFSHLKGDVRRNLARLEQVAALSAIPTDENS